MPPRAGLHRNDRSPVMDLHYLTASQAQALFAAKELSPVELLDAVVSRTEEVEPLVNALTEQMLDEAYAGAREAERRYVGTGPTPRALEGIPLITKEEQPIAGRTLEAGSLLEKGRIADVTHPVVERVRAAGAVLHARSATPEFSIAAFTHTKLWGVTRNPWNLQAAPGGSSGGAGAGLAAGETLLATGSDIGGSIRIPSSFCGVVGFKPPFGRVPGLPPFQADTYCTDGPMARSVADVALLQNVLAGPHPHDPASLRPGYVVPTVHAPATGMRVGLCLNLGDFLVDPVIEANTRAAADALRAAGVIVDEVTLPWQRKELWTAAWAHFGAVFGPFVDDILDGAAAEQAMPYTVEFAARAAEAGSYAEGLQREADLYRPLGELLERYDALLCPTLATTAIPADATSLDELVDVGNETLPWPETLMTLPFNVIGRAPVLALPSGTAANGIPTGVQIVGRTYDDATVFRLGAALERELALWTTHEWWPTV